MRAPTGEQESLFLSAPNWGLRFVSRPSSLNKFLRTVAIINDSTRGKKPPSERIEKETNSRILSKPQKVRLAAALVRGERLRKKMSGAEGGAISSAETSRLLGIRETAVLKRWHRHRLIGWTKKTRTFFPVWQFSGGKLLPGIEEVLKIFRSDDHWRVLAYFLCSDSRWNRSDHWIFFVQVSRPKS